MATASTKNQELLRKLGADETIGYTTQTFEDVAHNIDIVLDTIGGETEERSWLVLNKGGALISLVETALGTKSQSLRGSDVQFRLALAADHARF